MKETIKQRIQSALVNPINHINTELIVVMETGRRVSHSKFAKSLKILNSMVNKALFGKTFNSMAQHERVMMIFNVEETSNHTHAHALLRIPTHLNKFDVVNLMHEKWQIFDSRKNKLNKVYCQENEDEDMRIRNVIYATKKLTDTQDINKFLVF